MLCILISRPAHAWEKRWNEAPAIEDSCLAYDDRYSEAPLFQVVAAKSKNEKVYFFSRKTACPQGSSCPSRMKAYLVDGDVVFGGSIDAVLDRRHDIACRGEIELDSLFVRSRHQQARFAQGFDALRG